jgi:beta-lactamase regulating signal transducer with metallopeptidase domain
MSGALPFDPPAVAALLLNTLIMVTAVALVALATARLAPLRHDASARYLLCLAALICILFSPAIIAAVGRSNYGLIRLVLPLPMHSRSLPAALTASDEPPNIPASPPAPQPVGANLVRLLLLFWAAGSVWGAARFACGLYRALRLRQTVRPLDAATLGSAPDQVQRALRAPLPPVFISRRVTEPVAVGLVRPAVILPAGLAETLTPAQLRHVLLHECAHIAFRHAFGGLVQRLAGLLYWPHPLVAALCRELARAREEVCDNVASQEDGAACYARTLLAIAQGISAAPQYTSALALLGPGTSLEQRITGLLDPRRNRMVGMKRGKLWTVTGVMTLAVALAAAVRVVAADTQAPQQNTPLAKVTPDGIQAPQQAPQQQTAMAKVAPDDNQTPQQRAALAQKVRAEQAVLQAKMELDRRMSALPQQPIQNPSVQAKLEAERRAQELLKAIKIQTRSAQTTGDAGRPRFYNGKPVLLRQAGQAPSSGSAYFLYTPQGSTNQQMFAFTVSDTDGIASPDPDDAESATSRGVSARATAAKLHVATATGASTTVAYSPNVKSATTGKLSDHK